MKRVRFYTKHNSYNNGVLETVKTDIACYNGTVYEGETVSECWDNFMKESGIKKLSRAKFEYYTKSAE